MTREQIAEAKRMSRERLEAHALGRQLAPPPLQKEATPVKGGASSLLVWSRS